MRLAKTRLIGWPLSFQLLWAFGCSDGGPRIPPTETSLHKLSSYYGMYVTAHKGTGPENEDQLRAFIAKKSKANIDSLFRSDRDGQRYVIHYSSSAKPGVVIAHEKIGREGRRYVAMSTTEVLEMDEAAFRTAISKK